MTLRALSHPAHDVLPLRCPGVLVFVDECELIWTQRSDRRDRFLQALRELIDACPNGRFLCVAMATGIDRDISALETAYPALFVRLKGARSVPALVEVAGVPDAVEYADAFLKCGQDRAQHDGVHSASALFSDVEIQQLFLSIAGGPGKSATQGDVFDKLYTEAERRATAMVQA